MAKLKRKLSILTAILVMVTMTGTGVFATELSQAPATDVEDNAVVVEDVEEPAVDEAVQQEEEPVVEPDEEMSRGAGSQDQIDIAGATIKAIPDQNYTGSAITPALVVKYGDKELVNGTDYTAAYSNNVDVGTAKVTITGINSYKGTKQTTFKIVLAPVKKLTVLPGYDAFKLTWKAGEGGQPDYYFIQRKFASSKKVNRTRQTDAKETKACAWENAYQVNTNKKYIFTIYAAKIVGKKDTQKQLESGTGDDILSKGVSSDSVQSVKKMIIKVTMKTSVGALKAGKTYDAVGYGSGQYKIKKGKRTYSVARIKVRNQKAIYEKRGEMSHAAVEFFMNGGSTWAKGKGYVKKSKFKTKRTYFVWVNTFNQHAYVLKKKGGKYKCVDDWRVSMGTASTPSPTGTKTIIKYRAYHPGHGAPYWNFISWSNKLGHGTALHGLESGWAPKLGTLASHGCIRNPSEKAKALHEKYSGNGMKVVIY